LPSSPAHFDADVAAYRARGLQAASEARPPPNGGPIAYVDTPGELPGFIEVIECDSLMERTFSRFYQAAIAWDGLMPVGPFLDGTELSSPAVSTP